jgi:hypothetical protein
VRAATLTAVTAFAEPKIGDTSEPRAGSAELALRRWGFTGERLLNLAHAVANNELRRKQSTLGDRYDDLVSWLVEVGLKGAITYDPDRHSANYTFGSYLWDIMERRTADFYRRKGEGFGDRRYGNDGRIILVDDNSDDPDPDVDFDKLISEKRLTRWQHAAVLVEMTVSEWVVVTLDKAAARIERTAA